MNTPTKETAMLKYEVVKANDAVNEWIVEAIDYESEGEIYAARFSGPGCEQRAKEYAAWKNGRGEAG